MLTEEEILQALRACFDTGNPYGKPLNVVDLGMVERIELAVDEDAPGHGIAGVPVRQALRLWLAPAGDDADTQAMLAAQIENRLAGLAGLSRTSVQFLNQPAWNAERISPELRRTLKLDRPLFPILNARVR